MSKPDSQLLECATNGDRDALVRLLTRHGAAVRARVAKKIDPCWRSVLSADDVMQVTYLEVFLEIGRCELANTDAFVSWLTRVAEHNLHDAIRELQAAKRPDPRKRIVTSDVDDSFVDLFELVGGTLSTPSRVAARNEAKSLLHQALRQLPSDYRRVIELYDLEGQSVEQVASALNRTAGAVFMLRARALERLREILGGGSQFLGGSA